MHPVRVLIPDAEVRLPVACCLAASERATVHGLARHPAPHLKHSRFFASVEELHSESHPALWLGRIEEIISERQIDVVLPISEFAINTLSEHRHALSWAAKLPPLPAFQAFKTATDKANLAGFLGRCGLPHPPTVVVTAGDSIRDKIVALQFPVLAKPPLCTGGIGIARFDNQKSLTAFLAARPSVERWVLQAFLEGHDLGVNVLCMDGRILAATVQHAIEPAAEPFGSAMGVEFRNDPAAMTVVERLVHELNWSGIANVDLRFDAEHNVPTVLEVNGRYWLSLLGSLNAGVNFPLLACELCLDELKSNHNQYRARYFRGRKAVLSSLIGGGALRIRPHETDLPYFDPYPDATRTATSVAANVRDSLVRAFVPRRRNTRQHGRA
jgi:glutathione synthase/RimK-type ligase-like ATP-grasp enzyme